MNLGFVFATLAFSCVAIGAGAYFAPPANMHFGMQIITVVLGGIGATVFGFLAAVALLFGGL